MKKAIVSIIIPVYNAAGTIERALLSIQNQTYNNYEIIIVDDHSQDETERIIKKIMNKLKLKFYKNEGKGVSSSRNIGIEKAIGKYIVFLDSDDYYEANYLEHLVMAAENGLDLVCCNYRTIFANGNRSTKLKNNRYTSKNEINKYIDTCESENAFNMIWNKIFVTDIIKKNNIIFDEQLTTGEDIIFNINYLMNCNKVMTIDTVGYNYIRTNGNTIINSFQKNLFHQVNIVIKKKLELYNIFSSELTIERQMILLNHYSTVLINLCRTDCKINKEKKKEEVRNVLKSKVVLNYRNSIKLKKNINSILIYGLKIKNVNMCLAYYQTLFSIKKIINKIIKLIK